MYEHFRHELAAKLDAILGGEELLQVMNAVDAVAKGYEITGKGSADGKTGAQELPELARVYLKARATEGLSRRTVEHYTVMLRRFFADVRKAPEEVSTADVRAWLADYQDRRKIGNETLESYRVTLNSFFGWLTDEEYIGKNPVKRIKAIRYEKKQRKAMSQMELEYIRRACVTAKERALVEFLYSTGCRISEVAGAKRADVDWLRGEVEVLGKGSKRRLVYLNAKAVVCLQAYLETREDDGAALFVSDRAPHVGVGAPGLQKIIRRVCERCSGLGVHVTPHVFRHTTATVALQGGMPVQDVQRMLGHASINTTMIYAEVNQQEVKTLHERCVI